MWGLWQQNRLAPFLMMMMKMMYIILLASNQGLFSDPDHRTIGSMILTVDQHA